MSKYDTSFVAAVENRKREICLDLLRQNPETTLAELHQLSRGEIGKLLSSLTVSDLLNPGSAPAGRRDLTPKPVVPRKAPAGGKRRGAKAAGKAPRASQAEGRAEAAKPAKAEAPPEVNTRTPAGREAFNQAVFDALKAIGGPAGAGDIQRRVGGTNMQVRAAVNRLIEDGKVTWTGKARGTRYRLA